jgi:hypothetical protein
MDGGISFAPLPQRICAQCRREAPRHWITSMQLYCSHQQLLALRLPGTQLWRFYEGVLPSVLSNALATWAPQANRVLELWAQAVGTSKAEVDRRFTEAWLLFLDGSEAPAAGTGAGPEPQAS